MNPGRRCMRIQTIPSTYDIVGRVYSQDGLAPTINTLTDGGGGTINVCIWREHE